jgi:hypothetical protein
MLMQVGSAFGTKLPFEDVGYSVAIGGKADVHRAVANRRDLTHQRHQRPNLL